MQRGNSSSVKGQLSTHTVEGGRRGALTHTQGRSRALTLSETQLQSGDPAGRMVMLKAET